MRAERLWRLRWRLARFIAPTTIIPDPAPEAEAFLVVRCKSGEHPSWSVTHTLSKVDIKTELAPLDDADATAFLRRRRKTFVTAEGPA